jgi:hypothetical protein
LHKEALEGGENMARDDVLKSNLTKGAIGLAITAGAIAAGMLLTDEKSRTRITKKAKSTSRKLKRRVSTLARDYPERFQATAHNLRLGKGKSTGTLHKMMPKKGRGKSRVKKAK